MKTELKTLKDLGFKEGLAPRFFEVNAEYDGRVEEFIKSKLKSEAIKWVKEEPISPLFDLNTIMWIMHFFNLTEKEMK